MALAKPVITTTRGAEGIEVDPVRPPLVVADTTVAIAQAAIGLLADPVARAELGDRARAHVVAHHSPAAYGARLDRIVAELTAVPAARVAGAPAVAAS
jgi:glycosyltransferase involved in cell wall biosynthesis